MGFDKEGYDRYWIGRRTLLKSAAVTGGLAGGLPQLSTSAAATQATLPLDTLEGRPDHERGEKVGFFVWYEDPRIYVRFNTDGENFWVHQFDIQVDGGTLSDVQTRNWNRTEQIEKSDTRVHGAGLVLGANGGSDDFSFEVGNFDTITFDLQVSDPLSPIPYQGRPGAVDETPTEYKPNLVYFGADSTNPGSLPVTVVRDSSHVRVAHLVPDAPAVDVYVDGSKVLSGVEFRDVSPYLSAPAGTRAVKITPADDPDTIVFEGEVSFEAGQTTLAVVGELDEDSISVEQFADESGLHDPSKALVRVVHASPDAPAVTVSAGGSPLFEDLAFGEATDYAEVSPDLYEVSVGPAADPEQSVATFDLSADGCSIYTVFAAGYLTPDDEPADEPLGVVTALDDSGLEADYATQLSGANEVPPVDTDAAGSAVFDLREDGQVLRYEVAATGLENTLQGHIHRGGPEENGPVVAFLYNFAPLDASEEEARTLEGTLGNANITADDLVGPLEGEDLDALVDLIEAGEAYVNLHTVAHPPGEIRGQLGTEGM